MCKILIIGAGAMGSAFSFPCVDNGHEVSIIGSPLEDKMINEIKKNNIVDQNMIMFVTGLSGRSMQGGRFAISDIPEIVRVSARSYVDIIVNENY